MRSSEGDWIPCLDRKYYLGVDSLQVIDPTDLQMPYDSSNPSHGSSFRLRSILTYHMGIVRVLPGEGTRKIMT